MQIKEELMTAKKNLAGRVGSWSIRHRKAAILGWLVFVIAAFYIGGNMGMQKADPSSQGAGESGHASKILEAGWPEEKGDEAVGEQVLVESKSLDARSPRFKAAVADVMARLGHKKYVQEIESPYT